MISKKTIAHQLSQCVRPTALLAISAFLGACAVGPQYLTPPVAIGNGWSQIVPTDPSPAVLSQWWSDLADPELERLITTALNNNLDLLIALARIDEARALRDRIDSNQSPSLSANTSIQRRRQSENGPLPIGSMPGIEATQTIHDIGFDAAWEIDLFGTKQRASESANARLQMIEANAQGVRIRIAAEVARTWFVMVGTANELLIQQALVNNLQHTLQLMHQRHALGDITRAEVDIAYAQWANAKTRVPSLQAKQRTAALSLGVLLGGLPEQELALLQHSVNPLALPVLPVGQRADILRRRPDVLAAERQLAASTADIGVATAEFFPKLTIGIGGGFQALDLNDWFNASSNRFSILPFISWRLFDGGRVQAEIRARKAIEQQAALAYEKTVLTALGDAERNLSDYHSGLESLSYQQNALEATLRSYHHAKTRYAAGDIALIELLAAERLLHENKRAHVSSHTAAAIQLIALYKALGGGWDVPLI